MPGCFTSFVAWIKARLAYLGVLSLAVGLFSAYINISSKVVLESTEPMNPADPFSSWFQIFNSGNLDVYDVNITVSINSTHGIHTVENIRFETLLNDIPILRAREKMGQMTGVSFGLEHLSVNAADITFSVKFHPWLRLWTSHFQQRFITDRKPDGQFRWVSRPLK